MTKYPELFAQLAAPFDPSEIKQRLGGGGRQLTYITATTAANRLDNVLGPEGWDFEVLPWGEDALIGTITLRMPDGQVVKKSNVGGCAGMQADDDDAKSAASDCLKRCAMLVGVGRYLYRDGVPDFARNQQEAPSHPRNDARRDHQPQRQEPRQDGPRRSQEGQRQGNGHHGPPRSGKALFAWSKNVEQERGFEMLKYINGWAKLNEFPARMVEWNDEQVAQAYEVAQRKLDDFSRGKADGERPASGLELARPFPQNHSGHGRGQYANPSQIITYRQAMERFCAERNAEWADSWANGRGELPPGIDDLLHPNQLTYHLMKWGITTGRLANVGTTVDPETNKLVPKASIDQCKAYVAILWAREESAVMAECDAYTLKQKDAAIARMKARELAVGGEDDAWGPGRE